MEKMHWSNTKSPNTIHKAKKVMQYKDYIKEAAEKGNKDAQWHVKHGLKPY